MCISCSKDSVDEEQIKGTMQAEINGELIIFDSVAGERSLDLNTGWSPIHTVRGSIGFILNNGGYTAPNGYIISLYMQPSNGATNYNPHATVLIKVNYNKTGYQQLGDKGSVAIISRENNKYKGTFFFTAYNNRDSTDILRITKGKFEINQ